MTISPRSGTVVVGAVCPWIPVPNISVDIALLADCRMSYVREDHSPDPDYLPSDDTKKVLQLGRFAAGAYTGSPRSALFALGHLAAEVFYKDPRPAWTGTVYEQVRTQLSLGAGKARKTATTDKDIAECGNFEAMIGFFDKKAVPHILVFKSEMRTLSIRGPGPNLIGSGAAHNGDYNHKLLDVMRQNFKAGRRRLTKADFETDLAVALVGTFLDSAIDPFVGGGVQMVTIDPIRGFQGGQGLLEYRLREGEALSEEGLLQIEQMEWVSLTPEQLTPYPKPRRRSTKSINEHRNN